MKFNFLWLTLRLIGKQKLRTWTIFCGTFFSSFLLSSFGGLGYNFWNQVHHSTSETNTFDATQWILAALVLVLLGLVILCSVILMYNLLSLTFIQKWHSMGRLITLGADSSDLAFMTIIEQVIIFCSAASLGQIYILVLGKWIGVRMDLPIWMVLIILVWLFAISCLIGLRLLLKAIRTPLPISSAQKRFHNSCRSKTIRQISFIVFMANKYYKAKRGHYIRIILTMITVIVLYVPVSYLINTDLRVQQSELHKKYGIQYNYAPQNYAELLASLEECQNLVGENTEGDSLVYVQMQGRAFIKTELLNRELLDILRRAGWSEREVWESDSSIYFLDDAHYKTYLHSCLIQKIPDDSDKPYYILVDRVINRETYQENADSLFPDTELLNPFIWNKLSTDFIWPKIRIDYGVNYGDGEIKSEVKQCLVPDAISSEMPGEIDFTGNITLILPLKEIQNTCTSMKEFGDIEVYGCFEEQSKTLFGNLRNSLGPNGMGQLVYSKKVFQDWYNSMNEIHLAMTTICAILFFIALLNVFSTMVFQYIERKQGLAILWSLGQTENSLLQVLILENVRNFVISALIGLPVSCILCYYIYNIFCYVWRIDFVLPLKQMALIIIALITASLAATIINWELMRKGNFLQDIRNFQ